MPAVREAEGGCEGLARGCARVAVVMTAKVSGLARGVGMEGKWKGAAGGREGVVDKSRKVEVGAVSGRQ